MTDNYGAPQFLCAVVGRALLGGIGFAVYYFVAQDHVSVEQTDQVAPAMFAMAGVVGVFAGFAATAVVFVAAAVGPGIEKMRRDHGRRLTRALLGAVVVLLLASVGFVVCGLFANGWVAKGTACALLVAPVYDVTLVLLALRSAINSQATPPRQVQQDRDL